MNIKTCVLLIGLAYAVGFLTAAIIMMVLR